MAALRTPQLETDITDLAAIIRRVVRSRLRDPDLVDEAVQETLTRLIEARPRLDDSAVTPYAIVTARNLVVSLARSAERRRRHLHRLVDLRDVQRPEDEILRAEERGAVTRALSRLSVKDRNAIMAHDVHGVDTATLAREMQSTPGGVAVRLSRARARLRVEYLVAFVNSEPPTPRCRPVLIALSSGNRRRQLSLDAGSHLLDCNFCSALSDSLMERKRALAALVPLLIGDRLLAWVRHVPSHVWHVATATSVAAAAVGGALVVRAGPEQDGPRARPLAAPASCEGVEGVLISAGEVVDALPTESGTKLKACTVRIIAVPADEGFWISTGTGARAWVHLARAGESKKELDRGERVSFEGRVIAHDDDFASAIGVKPREGGEELSRRGMHIVTPEVARE
ncbi:MAG: sigma-70 family RNA polymerase sigma factor [Actinobacteria bacterium]|nr:sigma-70 family RNA polymerase sigma factor [Actinomycetota bacterium]